MKKLMCFLLLFTFILISCNTGNVKKTINPESFEELNEEISRSKRSVKPENFETLHKEFLSKQILISFYVYGDPKEADRQDELLKLIQKTTKKLSERVKELNETQQEEVSTDLKEVIAEIKAILNLGDYRKIAEAEKETAKDKLTKLINKINYAWHETHNNFNELKKEYVDLRTRISHFVDSRLAAKDDFNNLMFNITTPISKFNRLNKVKQIEIRIGLEEVIAEIQAILNLGDYREVAEEKKDIAKDKLTKLINKINNMLKEKNAEFEKLKNNFVTIYTQMSISMYTHPLINPGNHNTLNSMKDLKDNYFYKFYALSESNRAHFKNTVKETTKYIRKALDNKFLSRKDNDKDRKKDNDTRAEIDSKLQKLKNFLNDNQNI